ncbi:hypothetical protein F4805DRAFT_27158 [Annulohypoxylon moriforme]|nr:hypothetical protein F4805DRAFT_27158 [Annulohypoxylon moriforme]
MDVQYSLDENVPDNADRIDTSPTEDLLMNSSEMLLPGHVFADVSSLQFEASVEFPLSIMNPDIEELPLYDYGMELNPVPNMPVNQTIPTCGAGNLGWIPVPQTPPQAPTFSIESMDVSSLPAIPEHVSDSILSHSEHLGPSDAFWNGQHGMGTTLPTRRADDSPHETLSADNLPTHSFNTAVADSSGIWTLPLNDIDFSLMQEPDFGIQVLDLDGNTHAQVSNDNYAIQAESSSLNHTNLIQATNIIELSRGPEVRSRPTRSSGARATLAQQEAAWSMPAEFSPTEEEWDKVKPIVELLCQVYSATQEQIREILALGFHFPLTKAQLTSQMGRWPGCAKNKKCEQSTAQEKQLFKRSRSCWPYELNDPHPTFTMHRCRADLHRSIELPMYKPYVKLLFCVSHYVNAFLESQFVTTGKRKRSDNRTQESGAHHTWQIEWKWYSIFTRCQEATALARRRSILIQREDVKKARLEKNQCVKHLISTFLYEKVFSPLTAAKSGFSPQMLVQLWNIFRNLKCSMAQLKAAEKRRRSPAEREKREIWKEQHQPLLPRVNQDVVKWTDTPLNHPPNFVSELVCKITSTLKGIKEGHLRGLSLLLEALGEVPLDDLMDQEKPKHQEHMLRLGCLCTARTLTQKLGEEHSIVLNVWANYYRHWDRDELDTVKFCNSYQRLFEQTQRKLGRGHDLTILVLTDYTVAAYYVCRNTPLARELSLKLWGRLQPEVTAAIANGKKIGWTTRGRAIAESARILAQIDSFVDGEKQKTARQRFEDNRGQTQAQKRKRNELCTPPTPGNIAKAFQRVELAIGYLDDQADWDCAVAVASLYDCLGKLAKAGGRTTHVSCSLNYRQARDVRLRLAQVIN